MIVCNPLFFQMKHLISLPPINSTMPHSVHPDHAYSSTVSWEVAQHNDGGELSGGDTWLYTLAQPLFSNNEIAQETAHLSFLIKEVRMTMVCSPCGCYRF